MAKRKASSGMSGARKKKRTGRAGKTRVPRTLSTYGSVYRVQRREERLTDLVVSSATTGGYNSQAITFNLNQIQNKSDFANIFDQFRITRVYVEMYLVNNPDANMNYNTVNTNNASNWWPILYFDNDKEDDTPPTLAQMKQRQGVKKKRFSSMSFVKYSFVPYAMSALTTSTGGIASAMPVKSPWILMDASSTKHYGFKWGLDCFNIPQATQAYTARVEFKYDLEFKGVGRI